MKNTLTIRVLIFLLFLCRLQTIRAQCSPADNCDEISCIFSKTELETTLWNTANFSQDPIPAGFCSLIQNDQWFAFMADASQVQLTLQPSDCQNGDGFQAAVFKEVCQGTVVACNPGCVGCGEQPISLTFAADSGSIYYLIV